MQLAMILLFCVVAGTAQPLTTIRADVNLIELHAKVTDSQGRVVTGLTKDAFHLLIDGAPRPITGFQGEDVPVTAGIVIDNSASMAPKRDEVVAAALAFARASNENDQMFVVHFNQDARVGLPHDLPFTDNVAALETAISSFDPGGSTALYDALQLAEAQFQRGARFRKVLLTITDGGDNSSHTTLKDALENAERAGITVFSVGIFDDDNRDSNPQVLSKIAEATGGKAFFPKQLSDVTANCIQAANEIRQQYVLAFTEAAPDGDYHNIRLTVSDPKRGPLQVQTRAGYYSNKPDSPTGP